VCSADAVLLGKDLCRIKAAAAHSDNAHARIAAIAFAKLMRNARGAQNAELERGQLGKFGVG